MLHKILQSKWFTFPALILVGFLTVSLVKIEPTLTTTNRELTTLENKIADVKRSALELESLGNYLNSYAYLEQQARLRLNYKKPDEKVVYIYTKEGGSSAKPRVVANSAKDAENKLTQNLRLWWGYLIGK